MPSARPLVVTTFAVVLSGCAGAEEVRPVAQAWDNAGAVLRDEVELRSGGYDDRPLDVCLRQGDEPPSPGCTLVPARRDAGAFTGILESDAGRLLVLGNSENDALRGQSPSRVAIWLEDTPEKLKVADRDESIDDITQVGRPDAELPLVWQEFPELDYPLFAALLPPGLPDPVTQYCLSVSVQGQGDVWRTGMFADPLEPAPDGAVTVSATCWS